MNLSDTAQWTYQYFEVNISNLSFKYILSYEESEVKFVNAVAAGGSVNFFASGVNFSRNNAIYNINESTKYILS